MKRTFFLALLAFASTAGCSNLFARTFGTTHLPCKPPQGVQAVLIYPADQATGIPDNLGQVIFAASALEGLSTFHAHLTDETSAGKLQVDFVPFDAWGQAIPQPAETPPFSNANYEASINGGVAGSAAFPQGHQIQVDLAGVNCDDVTYGYFTVQ